MEQGNRNAVDRGPSRTAWPPLWLAGGSRAADNPPATPSTLPPDLRERWEERVAVMHHDGGLPLPDAERQALADILQSEAWQ
jgi:hypothetical protein